MNTQETAQLLTIIQKSYPTFHKDFDPEVFDFQVKLWARSLADYTLLQCKMAFEKWVNTQGFPPQLNQFKETLVTTIKPNSIISPEKAWEAVSDAVKRFGSYGQEKAFQTFSEPTKRAVRNIGGWQKICETELGQKWDFLRKNFIETYKEFSTSETEQYLLPPDTLRRIQELQQKEEPKRLEDSEDKE